MSLSLLPGCTVLLFALSCIQPLIANALEVPLELPGATLVSAGQVKLMMDQGVLVVDTRVGNEFAESHIKGAINVPYKENSRKVRDFDAAQDSFDLSKLPADKAKPIVFYCNAGACWKSYKASTMALRAGYPQVYWFRGGYGCAVQCALERICVIGERQSRQRRDRASGGASCALAPGCISAHPGIVHHKNKDLFNERKHRLFQ